MQILSRIVFVVVLGLIATNSDRAAAQIGQFQTAGVTVQLPVIQTRSVSTVVSVPDGGTINLSGGSSSFRQSSRSGFGRFSNSNRFGGGPRTGTSVSARIIQLRELEQEMLADHLAARSQTGGVQVNGTKAVQAKADFITRNVGR